MVKRSQRKPKRKDPFYNCNSKSMYQDTMNMAGGIIGLGMVVEVSKNLRQNL